MRRLILVLLLLPPALTAAAADGMLETPHYRLEVPGADAAEVAELGRLLEATWTGLEDWFGAAPKLARGDRLTVRLFPSREAWHAGMRADHLTPPPHGGGYYAPSTKTAYLYRQPTAYFTRVLLVHEATHQFHFLARTGNRSPSAAWYTEGLAEHLSWHQWDGETLHLGRRPWVTLKDHPRVALALLEKGTYDLGRVIEGKVWPEYPLAWALFTYLATGRDGKPLKGFSTFRRKMDQGGQAAPLFRRAFGGGDRFEKRFRAWLSGAQQPWIQVFNQWEDRGRARLRGHAGFVSLCRTREVADELHANLDAPPSGRWRAGLLVEFLDAKTYVIATIQSDGRWRVERRKAGRWERVTAGRLEPKEPGKNGYALSALRRGTEIEVRVGAQILGRWKAARTPLGLVVDNGDLTFRNVAWKAASPR